MRIRKYPRTPHLESSALQPGDEDLRPFRFAELVGRDIVVEEKIDGANAGVWFDAESGLVVQSRGHALLGGPRERHFDGFKGWARTHERALREVLGHRYLVYGEWCYAKHTIFYDALPSWFLAFDVYDAERDVFLASPVWRALLGELPISTVPVLYSGPALSLEHTRGLVGRSAFITEHWRDALAEEAAAVPHVDVERTVRETDPSAAMEGVYLKVEHDGVVVDRAKWVRPGFLQVVVESDSHWQSRPIVRNRCRGPS